MEINIENQGKRLEEISEGDVLVFPNRKEIVEQIIPSTKTLRTQRKNGKLKRDLVAYEKIEIITPFSRGEIYGSIEEIEE